MWEEYCEEYKEQYTAPGKINSFDACVAAGNPVMESYPRQCAANGETFTEQIDTGDVVVKDEFDGKVVYEDSSAPLSFFEDDCSLRGGVFDTCGTICAPDAEVCPTVCAYVCVIPSFTEIEAYSIAATACADGDVSDSGTYNSSTKTWWFDFSPTAPVSGCNPACVVMEETGTAEINWRCTGLITE